MSKRYAPHAGAFAALVLIFAAALAALISHAGIDFAGDFLLAHDTYDGLDHRSRSDVFALGLSIAIGALLRVVCGAIREARTGGLEVRASFDDLFGRGPWRFVVLVVGLTLPALAAMEAFDLRCDGGTIDDPADLFGGSFALGLSIAVPVAALAAFAVRFLSRILSASQHTLSAALVRLIALITRAGRSARSRSQRRGCGFVRRCRSILSRRCGKRGPPLFAS